MQKTKIQEEEWNAIKEEIRKELKAELIAEIKDELRDEIKAELNAVAKNEMLTDVHQDMQMEKQEVSVDCDCQTDKAPKTKKPKKSKCTKNSLLNGVVVEVITLLVGMVLLCLSTYKMLFNFWLMERYVNLLILLLLLLLTLPTIIAGGFWKDFTRVISLRQPEQGWKLYELKRSLDAIDLIQKQLCYAAVMIVMFQLIGILYNMSDPSTLGPSMANILMTGFYTAIMELLLMPLKVEVKKRIADYMEEK